MRSHYPAVCVHCTRTFSMYCVTLTFVFELKIPVPGPASLSLKSPGYLLPSFHPPLLVSFPHSRGCYGVGEGEKKKSDNSRERSKRGRGSIHALSYFLNDGDRLKGGGANRIVSGRRRGGFATLLTASLSSAIGWGGGSP